MGAPQCSRLPESQAHEIQLHIHHEYYTATRVHTDSAAIEWFASAFGRSLDEQRLDLAIRLNREIIARETGQTSERWFFVHGQWALNASDDRGCTISNEIALLQRHGCRGDFTFPAGNSQVDPRIKVPYLCRPLAEPKGYDRPEAAPELACGNRAAASAKFFIWASAATGQQCSLDYMSEASRRHVANTENAAKQLIDGSYVAGRQLFIKTHAHSMHSYYSQEMRSPVFPHQHPAAQTLLAVIFDAAALAGLDVQFLTASEVYDRVLDAASSPAGELDLVGSYMRPANPFRDAPLAALGHRHPARDGAKQRAVNAQSVPSTVELVRETIGQVLGRRISDLGIRGSGAYEHYSAKLQLGFPIPNYELAALDIVQHEVPSLAGYHEIGSGIGSLPFLLALNGLRSAGVERDRRRHDTAVAIWQQLAALSGVAEGDCRLINGSFPRALRRLDASQSIAIVTDFITTQTPQQVAAILTGLCRYRYVLLDLRRFCIRRETREAQLTLIDELRARGFAPPMETSDPAGNDYTLALFRNQSPARRCLVRAALSRVVVRWRRKQRSPTAAAKPTAAGDMQGASAVIAASQPRRRAMPGVR